VIVIRIDGVTHRRGTVTILHDVSLSLGGAALVVLAGRSGSGKSTLCHLVAGVMRPSSGSVLVADGPAHRVRDWAVVSLLPQRLALAPEVGVAEGARRPARRGGRAVDPLLLESLGLDAIADRPVRETSLGEQQRTALERALVLGPSVAVLDEPTGHQDDEHVGLILDALVSAARAGTLVLVATHDQRVIDLADETVRLRSGRIAVD
jgi:ABC-type lipoprotein export system ATPase subunit